MYIDLQKVYVHITPTNIDNRLKDGSKTNYVITPLNDLIHLLQTFYEEGLSGGVECGGEYLIHTIHVDITVVLHSSTTVLQTFNGVI